MAAVQRTIDLTPTLTATRTVKGTVSNLVQPSAGTAGQATSARLKALEQTIGTREPELISVDLFDTVLLRGSEPQRARWMGSATRAAHHLNHHGNRVSAYAILGARASATRAAMSMTNVMGGPEDVPLQTIFSHVAGSLGLPDSTVRVMIEAELAEERARLKLNVPLLDLLSRHRSGRRIVITSDTNLSASMLAGLLDHFDASLRFNTIRTSSDMGLTKQKGSIFPAIVKLEGVREPRILHIGDDALADVEMPSRHGIAPFHLQRRDGRMLVRRARKFFEKVVHGER